MHGRSERRCGSSFCLGLDTVLYLDLGIDIGERMVERLDERLVEQAPGSGNAGHVGHAGANMLILPALTLAMSLTP